MPGINGTGPAGQGPMTGRGAGYCGNADWAPGQGFGRGFGCGRGRQMGQGRGQRFGWSGQEAHNNAPAMDVQTNDVIQSLADQVAILTKKLDELTNK